MSGCGTSNTTGSTSGRGAPPGTSTRLNRGNSTLYQNRPSIARALARTTTNISWPSGRVTHATGPSLRIGYTPPSGALLPAAYTSLSGITRRNRAPGPVDTPTADTKSRQPSSQSTVAPNTTAGGAGRRP
ncbi:hypothetical protein EDD99_8127 [Streptomyces sp. 846.5]|nr:hypothetical protein EDD99_8127 [Streptomyces sp. 846.5]